MAAFKDNIERRKERYFVILERSGTNLGSWTAPEIQFKDVLERRKERSDRLILTPLRTISESGVKRGPTDPDTFRDSCLNVAGMSLSLSVSKCL